MFIPSAPEDIRQQFSLSSLLELSGVQVRSAREGPSFDSERERKPEGIVYARMQRWLATFVRPAYIDEREFRHEEMTHTLALVRPAAEQQVAPALALAQARTRLDMLCGFTGRSARTPYLMANYPQWREHLRERFGVDAHQTVEAFESLLRVYDGLQYVFDHWFPVLLYGENDLVEGA